MTNRKSNIIINKAQGLIWACLFILPSAVWYFIASDIQSFGATFHLTTQLLLPAFLVYTINYCVLIPLLLFSSKRKYFYIINSAIILFLIALPVIRDGFIPDIPQEVIEAFPNARFLWIAIGGVVLKIIFYAVIVAMPVGLKYVMRWNEEKHKIEEERRRNAEAELNWLKNQLNPHFLFNTLNNISSLTQIDPDKAQESIGQLSELLRYALYESNVRKVRICDEVEFMKNYIDLMALRCNDSTRIETRFDKFANDLMISPLLFISLIENAFKHGTSAHKESFVKIDLGMDGDDLVFSCENSLLEKCTTDFSGSGIGLENMKRRLELLYHDAYSYKNFTEDGVYIVLVRIQNIGIHV